MNIRQKKKMKSFRMSTFDLAHLRYWSEQIMVSQTGLVEFALHRLFLELSNKENPPLHTLESIAEQEQEQEQVHE